MALFFITLCCNAFGSIKFHGTEETLSKIREIILSQAKGAYLRFGDGDINLALGDADSLQRFDRRLSLEMKEAFSLNGPTVLKTLNMHCRELGGYEPEMFPGNHEIPYEMCLDMMNKARPLWGEEVSDVYSAVALHYAATHRKDSAIGFLKFLRRCSCILIGNQTIPKEIRDLLFGKECVFIPTPPKNAYDKIDAIEKECLKKITQEGEYKVVITAMGCSGRVLQKRLWHKLDRVFFFDFGSLIDALCEKKTRAWIELTHFDANSILDELKKETHIVLTAALIDNQYESRKEEYIKALTTLRNYGFKNPHIIESICAGKTFLNDYSENVIYPNVNNFRLRNKGVNEVVSILNSLDKLHFNDEDMIVKITGRYYFISDHFLKTVESHPSIDVFAKLSPDGQVYTGCFAMRYKYFKELFRQIDVKKMEREGINVETEVANYIQKIAQPQNVRVMYLDRLDLVANIFGNGCRELVRL